MGCLPVGGTTARLNKHGYVRRCQCGKLSDAGSTPAASTIIFLFFCTILLCLFFSLAAHAQDAKITIFEGAQKTLVPLQNIEGSPYIRLSDFYQPFGLAVNPIAANQSLSVTAGDHNIILSANRALVSLDGKLISLNQPVYVVQGEWFVPLDFISKVIKSISEKRVLWLESSRSLILGDVLPNQVILKYSLEQDYSRSCIAIGASRRLQDNISKSNSYNHA